MIDKKVFSEGTLIVSDDQRRLGFVDNTLEGQSTIQVKTNEDRIVSARLYDLSGQPVRVAIPEMLISEGTHNFFVDVSDLGTGAYILVGEMECPEISNNDKERYSELGIKPQ